MLVRLQTVDSIVGVSRECEFQQALEVDPGNLVAPAFGRIVIEMTAEEPSTAKRCDTDARAFSGSLYVLPIAARTDTSRSLRALVLIPLLVANIVFPDRVGSWLDNRLI